MPTSYFRDNARTRNPKCALVSPSKRKKGNHLVSLHSKFYIKWKTIFAEEIKDIMLTFRRLMSTIVVVPHR